MAGPTNHKKNSQFSYPQPNSALRQNPTNRGKSLTHFLFKACFFAAIIVSVPLFPSQAPEFISQSPLTKFWELIHLLFIGIAVSYGLFCRRNVEPEIDFEIQTEMESDSFQHGMSRMFHISSRSEEGYQSLPGFDERRVIQNPNGICNNSLLVENSTIQAWNSQYFQGNPIAVVAQPNCSFAEFTESGSEANYKPLGLPVRSLRESEELFSNIEPSSGSFGSIESFGHSGPKNSENEPDASPSPIPWRSRSMRREKLSHVSHTSHFRPLSADETQFESFQTMRASSPSSSQGDNSPANSVASVVMGSNIEDDLQETSFLQGSYSSSGSPSPPPKPRKRQIVRRSKSSRGSSSSSSGSPMDGKASTGAMHSRGYSFGSVYENELIGPKEYLKESSEASDSKESDEKKPNLKRASVRGKSVRTVRSYGLIMEAENPGDFQGNQVDDQDVETVFWGDKGVGCLENGNAEQSFVPKPTTPEIRGFDENVSAKSERDYEAKDEKFLKSMSVDTDSESVRSTRTADSNEVDKKAGEFIAKFREQIRLQKVASMDRTRGLRFGPNYFR